MLDARRFAAISVIVVAGCQRTPDPHAATSQEPAAKTQSQAPSEEAPSEEPFETGDEAMTPWTLRSLAFDHARPIPKRHTGDGEDLSPALAWSEPPAATRELALIVDDPDAPTTEPWVHWLLYKIPSSVRNLPEGIPTTRTVSLLSGAVQGLNSWRTVGYRGPAPPPGHGTHHYHFKLYALDAALAIDAGLDKRALLQAMQGHILAVTELIGLYQR